MPSVRRFRVTPLGLFVAGLVVVILLSMIVHRDTHSGYSFDVRDFPVPKGLIGGHQYKPSPSFRDTLHPDTKYLTGWGAGGLTNSFISYVNVIYLAMLAQRIPVLPAFTPIHVGHPNGDFRVSGLFDLARLGRIIGTEVLEWHQIKDYSAKSGEELNCWSLRQTFGLPAHLPPFTPTRYSMNITFAPAPEWTKLTKERYELYTNYLAVLPLLFPSGRAEGLKDLAKNHVEGSYKVPDDQMACFDLMYFTTSFHPAEWDHDWNPGWRFVGTHMRWNTTIYNIAKGMVNRRIGTSGMWGSTKKFISVHVRRSDFRLGCPEEIKECLPPLSKYARLVKEVQTELEAKFSVDVDEVLVSSDEDSPEWWNEVEARGWKRIDHVQERTAEKYGDWFVPMFDIVIQSMAVGFVGTAHSTLSLVSANRVIDWNGGVTRILSWDAFNPDA